MSNILKFPTKFDADIKEMEAIIWPNKVEVIRRRVEFEIEAIKRHIKLIEHDFNYTREEKQSWEYQLEGLEQALYIIEQEGK